MLGGFSLHYRIEPLGDSAVIVEFGTEIDESIYRHVQQLIQLFEETKPKWLIEYVPAYTTVTVFYDPLSIRTEFPYAYVRQEIDALLSTKKIAQKIRAKTVDIPVCYGGEFGPDLAYVAKYNGLTEEEVVDIHSSGDYLVYMLGFAPGFPYIGGMSPKIATPRRKTPRLKIPARSVGIAGHQTGIYPIETPGGWQLIGKTPLPLFNVNEIGRRSFSLVIAFALSRSAPNSFVRWRNDCMLTIVKPGLLTTIQDLGRYGWQKYGIVVSGAMDPIAHRLANILVMNDENCPTLEMTLVGATLRFEENTVIALTGADMSPRLNGRRIPIGTAIAVEKGDVLEFGIAENGCRTYSPFMAALTFRVYSRAVPRICAPVSEALKEERSKKAIESNGRKQILHSFRK